MRHHLAHQVWQRLASKVGKRNPARIFWRARAHWCLRNVNDQVERKMREHMRRHAGDAAPACARELQTIASSKSWVRRWSVPRSFHRAIPSVGANAQARIHPRAVSRTQPAPTPPFRLGRLDRKGLRITTHAGRTGVTPRAERAGGLFRSADGGAEIHQALGKIPAARSRGERLCEPLDLRFRRRQRFVDSIEPRHHALHIAIDRHRARISNCRDRGRGVAADAGSALSSVSLDGNCPSWRSRTARAQACRLRARA